MKLSIVFTAMVAIRFLVLATAAAQVHEAWVARLTNGVATAMRVDSAGNVYLTGSAGTVKFDNNGNQLWLVPSEAGVALAIDDPGSVYVLATNAASKLNAAGQTIWSAPWTNDPLRAIVVGQAGDVFVTSGTVIAKYDTNGNGSWTAEADSAFALGVDGAGNLFVAGTSGGLRKLNPTGETAWTVPNVPVAAMVVDQVGNVCIVGSTAGAYSTAMYGSDGKLLWRASYKGHCAYNRGDYASDIVQGSDGSVCVTGRSAIEYVCWQRGCEFVYFGNHEDIVTIKYDRFGNQLWAARLPVDTTEVQPPYDRVHLSLDPAGNVFVTGTWRGLRPCAREFVTASYDTLGSQRWMARFVAQASGLDQLGSIGIGLDAVGNTMVVGNSIGEDGTTDYTLLKYVQSEIPGAPRISVAPQSQTVTNQDLSLSVTATGADPLAYQWFRNRTLIPNETNAMLNIANASWSADFSVRITNGFGAVHSAEARVVNRTAVTLCCLEILSESQVSFTVSAASNLNYTIEISTDLVDWGTVYWYPTGGGQIRASRPEFWPAVFYRARERNMDCNSCGQ